jgi:hypothetical protein
MPQDSLNKIFHVNLLVAKDSLSFSDPLLLPLSLELLNLLSALLDIVSNRPQIASLMSIFNAELHSIFSHGEA